LMPLRGVIDSTDIPLNVSRSALTSNRTVRRISDYITRKIGDRLKSLYNENFDEYVRCWQDIGTFVKFGVMKDDKFKKHVKDLVIFRTTADASALDGGGSAPAESSDPTRSESDDPWHESGSTAAQSQPSERSTQSSQPPHTTLQSYLERNKDRHENRVFYCTDPTAQATYVELYTKQGLEVLYMDSFIDNNYFVPFLEQEYENVQFARVDAEIDAELFETEGGGEIVDPSTNKTRSDQVRELFEQAIDNSKVNVKTQALKVDDPQTTPPAMVLLPEAMRRMRDMSALMQQQPAEFPDEHVLMVNTSHPLIQNIAKLSQGSIIQGAGQSPSGELAHQLCRHVYDLALMAQKGFDPEGMTGFVQRSNQVLTRLTQ